MDKFDYLFTFISLTITIGISGLLNNLNNLLKLRDQVKWHWLPLGWSLIILLALIQIWFSLFYHLDNELTETAGGFFMLFLPVIFVLLTSMAVLPNKPSEEGLDLKNWYFKQKNYLIILLILSWISYLNVKLFEEVYVLTQFHISKYVLAIIPLILYVILLNTKKVWVHSVVVFSYLTVIIYILTEQRIMN